jgi:outer membrane immunogenic protein
MTLSRQHDFFEFSAHYPEFTGDTMIKQLIAATVALGTFTFSGAHAADLPLPVKAPPPPPPAWTWTGCYVGIEGGGAIANDRVTASTGALVGRTVTTITPSNGLVGGTFGCNYQFSQFFLIGIEDDLSWNAIQARAGDLAPFVTTFSHSVRGTWLDTLRGRVGIVTWDNALFYATGGAAFAGLQDSVAGSGGVGASATTNATGWTAGGGVEWMPFRNWTVKIEYLFMQFPTVADAFNTAPPVGTLVGVNTRLSENIIRAGVNWHFTWWAPVATRF